MTGALLEAGAILPAGEMDAGQDVVTARRYAHPALSGRTVVRLVGATLGEAEDLSMEFLGFTRTRGPAEVGRSRRQSLGFPAWALVNDPANGRHALALVKEMERLARTARSKPGNARDGFQRLASRLGAAAPHFLPTFWEQAGRAFLVAGNQRMAGGCFTEARRAEQVHGLPVDERRLRDVHLEFAFAGALTAKALTGYARAVATRRPAPEAYELVRALAVRRVAGGLPPYVGMAEDLKRLAKAAGLDPAAQAEAVIGQLLAFPALTRAHESVWQAYRPALVRLARRDAAARARLLEILPEPPGWDTDAIRWWLELLEATGATDDLLAGRPAVASAARWLERLIALRERRHRLRRDQQLVDLVRRLAPRLRAAGRPVVVWERSWAADLDLLDVCLAEGVPVGMGRQGDHFPVARWLKDGGPGRRDLSAVAADPRCRPLLVRGADDAVRELHGGSSASPIPEKLLTGIMAAPGLREVVAKLLTDRAVRANGGTVLGLDDTLGQLAAVWSPIGLTLVPAAFAALADVDVPAVLARTLRAGLPEELGWPEYERAVADKLGARIGGAWPAILVHDNRVAHVVGPDDGAVHEHHFRYPAEPSPYARYRNSETECRLVGDQFLVTWLGIDRPAGYWSTRPDELFEADQPTNRAPWGRTPIALPLPDGSVTTGERPWHVGDHRAPTRSIPVAGDGKTFWRCEPPAGATDTEWRWREYDPVTGAGGRPSLPAFLAAEPPAGGTLVPELSELRPAPAEWAASPLGWRDGLVGWRVVRLPDGTQLGEGVDGRRVSWHPDSVRRTNHPYGEESLVAAVRLPGGDAPLPVTGRPQYRDELVLTVWSADGAYPIARCGMSRHLPPVAWWHALTARDEAGSARLRRLDASTAARLLAVDDTVTRTTDLADAVAARVAATLPEVTDPVLRKAVESVVARAVRLRRRLAVPPQPPTDVPVDRPAVDGVADHELRLAWNGLLSDRMSYYAGDPGIRRDVLRQITAVGRLLAGAELDEVPAATPSWTGALAGLGALAVRAAAPTTPDGHRAALVALLSTVADTGLADAAAALRVLDVTQDRAQARRFAVHRDGDQVTVLLEIIGYHTHRKDRWSRTAIQAAPGGTFTPPPGATVETETVAGGWRGTDGVRDFCRLLAERGPAPWRPDAVDDLVGQTGMTRAEATLLLAGLPELDSYEAAYLTPGQRAALGGLTAQQARAGRDALRGLTHAQRVALVDAAMPADPAVLWDRGPAVAALAERWIALRGVRVPVPEDLLAEGERVLPAEQVADTIQTIAAPAPGGWLTTDGEAAQNDAWSVPRMTAATGTPFDSGHLYASAVALLWLAYALPWGDPIRAALPRALDLARDRLRNPHLLVGLGWHRATDAPAVGPALVHGGGYHDFVYHHLAPARLTGADDPALGFVDDATAGALRALLSPHTIAAVATPAGATGEHRDPRTSAPELVDTVAVATGLDRDAAAYYLQLLALPDPTDRNVRAWTGWRPAELKRIQAAGVDAGLLVTGKRERAGRGVFLPGGWLALKNPSPPMETWKRSLYLAVDRLILVPRPTPELFHAAWARVAAGDVPRYLDLGENRAPQSRTETSS